MTKQCREALSVCDFPDSAARDVESFVSRCSVLQIEKLVWSKDPDGKHTADWFAPFFNNGYVRSKIDVVCSFDEKFWDAYDWLSQALPEDFSVFELPLIDAMARNTKKMKAAVGKSRVLSLPYIYKVYQGMEDQKVFKDNNNSVSDFEIGSTNIKTKEYT